MSPPIHPFLQPWLVVFDRLGMTIANGSGHTKAFRRAELRRIVIPYVNTSYIPLLVPGAMQPSSHSDLYLSIYRHSQSAREGTAN